MAEEAIRNQQWYATQAGKKPEILSGPLAVQDASQMHAFLHGWIQDGYQLHHTEAGTTEAYDVDVLRPRMRAERKQVVIEPGADPKQKRLRLKNVCPEEFAQRFACQVQVMSPEAEQETPGPRI